MIMNDFYEMFKALSPIMAACITGYCLLLVHRSKEMKVKLLKAYQDVRFYQAVEEVHVDMNVGRGEGDNKKKVRAVVRKEFNFQNSGLAPSQVERAIEKFKRAT